ncbi:Microfibrillar-associated protein 1 [Gracilariopsis chorda]|uniref:Microfibrillar-associated protein 1 n=1 Tax=Gracilariopsis chorda TaxID=448386 RepID=A0A2V3IQ27_9FLOR|nr:Microfibrillar-associated protein 1 [Gracilariopsis chorda]|eukprot:PXF44191.1 Microfibrillar-associated protein 1 [Gracilariopsis chorda]
MKPLRQRYFPGKPPVFHNDSDSEADSDTRSEPQPQSKPTDQTPKSNPPRRKRFVARVVSQPQPEQQSKQRGTPTGFLPVTKSDPVIEPPEPHTPRQNELIINQRRHVTQLSSSSSSSSQSSNSEQDNEQESNDKDEEPTPSTFRPLFVKPRVDDSKQHQEKCVVEAEQRYRRRRNEARQLVTDLLNDEDRQLDGINENEQLPDDRDYEEDREAEFALWRVRELHRIKRDREADKAWAERKNVTAERKDEEHNDQIPNDQETPSNKPSKPAFLQRSYKMGPFFLEKDETGRFSTEIYNRDYNQPTEGEKYDRTALPKPLQVKHGQLGRAGRSKFAHLAAEDTAGDFIREVRGDRELRKTFEDHKSNK